MKQDENESSICNRERFACRELKVSDSNEDNCNVSSDKSIFQNIAASRKRKKMSESETFVNTRFILVLVAEIE